MHQNISSAAAINASSEPKYVRPEKKPSSTAVRPAARRRRNPIPEPPEIKIQIQYSTKSAICQAGLPGLLFPINIVL